MNVPNYVLDGLDCIAELIENPEADASDGDRLVMLQQLRGVRKVLKNLKSFHDEE